MQVLEGINYVYKTDWILVKKLHQVGPMLGGFLELNALHPVKCMELVGSLLVPHRFLVGSWSIYIALSSLFVPPDEVVGSLIFGILLPLFYLEVDCHFSNVMNTALYFMKIWAWKCRRCQACVYTWSLFISRRSCTALEHKCTIPHVSRQVNIYGKWTAFIHTL